MSVAKKEIKRITTHVLHAMKEQGEKISMLTAYDYSMARILDDAGIDILLVGDSASNVMAGTNALNSAISIMKESGAHAVKLEGGAEIEESVRRILSAGVPVMGHLGLTPQSIYKFGTYSVRAREEAEAQKLKEDAKLLQEIGCFAIVLEKIPAVLGKEVAESLHIPVIGIGAGNGVDGQVLVVLGITKDFNPRFLRRYLNLYETIKGAVETYISDIKTGDFPNEDEQY